MPLAREIEVLTPALTSLPIAVMATDCSGVIRWANTCLCNLTGYAVEELVGQNVEMLEPENTTHSRREILQHVISAGEPWEGETDWKSRSGERLDIEQTITPIRGRSGAVTHALWTLQNITERKRAEETLRESKVVLRAVLNAIPVRVFWKDRNLVYLGCNAPFASDAGLEKPEDIIGLDDYATNWGGQAEHYRADDRAVIESGVAKLLIEETQTTPSGEQVDLLTSKVPLRDANGAIVGVMGTYYDVTERKRAQNALRESESVLSESQRVAHVGSWSWDLATDVMTWTPEMYRVFGVSLDTFVPSGEALLSRDPPGRPGCHAGMDRRLYGRGRTARAGVSGELWRRRRALHSGSREPGA